MVDELINDLKKRMASALEVLHKEFTGLRTGRASASLLEPVKVEAYGSLMPLTQVATISVPEPRMLVVQVWDRDMVKPVEKAIRDANLGLNPMGEGQTIRVPMPDLNEQRRQELVKVASKYAEQTRVAIRNIRRDGMDGLKKMEKNGDISEDMHHKESGVIQALTDEHIKKTDEALTSKEKDIMQV
jgi:ribosome recycling factor